MSYSFDKALGHHDQLLNRATVVQNNCTLRVNEFSIVTYYTQSDQNFIEPWSARVNYSLDKALGYRDQMLNHLTVVQNKCILRST